MQKKMAFQTFQQTARMDTPKIEFEARKQQKKLQWRNFRGFGKIYTKKKALWAKYIQKNA